MCIISNWVDDVVNTEIFVAPDEHQKIQLTVYSNKVKNSYPNNAMILPVPYPNTVHFYDMKHYCGDFFGDCKKLFYSNVSRSGGGTFSATNGHYRKGSSETLKVFDVGDYKVSLAFSLDDLNRVNEKVFSMSPGCKQLLEKDYSNPMYGFIICKLKDSYTLEQYKPFAYSHKIVNGNKIFIPTKHYHENHAIPNINPARSAVDMEAGHEQWDHCIYMANCFAGKDLLTLPHTNKYTWKGNEMTQNCLRMDDIGFTIPLYENFEKHVIKGNQPNIDLDGFINQVQLNIFEKLLKDANELFLSAVPFLPTRII